jgi:cytochrome b subunit of formate dehydrogenase
MAVLVLTLFGVPADGIAATADAGIPAGLDNATCQSCHDGSKTLTVPGADDEERELVPVHDDKYAASVHSKMQCVDCHTDIVDAVSPHQKATTPAKGCAQCHTELWEAARKEGKAQDKVRLGEVAKNVQAYDQSFHARPNADDKTRPNASCHECHNTHTFNVPAKGTKAHGEWRATIPQMCGESCHEDHLEDFVESVHGKEILEEGNAKAAVCSDCHTTHEIINTSLDAFKLRTIDECGNCHEENLKTYRDSYHGKVTQLGHAYTAKCSDCHGSHLLLRVDDPESKVHPDNRLKTCQKCHDGKKLPEATGGFLSFGPHAHAGDKERYPQVWYTSKFMIGLLIGVFAYFWAHSLLWWYREYKDRKEGKGHPHVRILEALHGHSPEKHVRRFGLVWRIGHLSFALCVMILILTGMSVHYADSPWAPVVVNALGGPKIAGIIHRTAAAIMLGIFFLHLIGVATNIARNWKTFRFFGPDSLVPRWQDFKDAWGMFKWFAGKGPRPIFDRWTYWEKFDYWAVFWGMGIIGSSGLMLSFPTVTASIVPGWVLNVATLVHGEEAFLAAVFLFTVHFFNNHFRPDKMPPPDVVMFTGVQTLEEFRREHTAQYNRLLASGELEKYIVDAPSAPMTLGSKVLGLMLIATGLTLLTLVAIGFFGIGG